MGDQATHLPGVLVLSLVSTDVVLPMNQPESVHWIVLTVSEEHEAAKREIADPNVRAVVLLLSKSAIEDIGFLSVIVLCLERLDRDHGFGVFVDEKILPRDSSGNICKLDEHLPIDGDTLKTLVRLVETVQVPRPRDLIETLTEASEFAPLAKQFARADQVKRLRSQWASWFGRAASYIEIGCGLVVATVGLLSLLPQKVSMSSALPAAAIAGLHVMGGVPNLLSILLPLVIPETRRGIKILAIFAMLFIVRGGVVLANVGGDSIDGWFLFGQCLGIILEVVRRVGLPATWFLHLYAKSKQRESKGSSADVGRLCEQARKSVRTDPMQALVLPLIRRSTPTVFLSYTRGGWSANLARECYDQLSAAGARVFYDAESITNGTRWRRELYCSISRATLIVAIVDDETLSKPWPAREVATALLGYGTTRMPEIIVLTHTNLHQGKPLNDSTFSVFDLLLKQSDSKTSRRWQLIEVPDNEEERINTLAAIAWGLTPSRYASPGLLPRWLNDWVNYWGGSYAGRLGEVGIFGGLSVWLALPALVAVASHTFRPLWFIYCAMAAGYWTGFVARSTMAIWIEQRKCPAFTRWTQLLAAVGLIMGITSARTLFTPLDWAWACLTAAVGWLVCGHVREVVADAIPERFLLERSPNKSAGTLP